MFPPGRWPLTFDACAFFSAAFASDAPKPSPPFVFPPPPRLDVILFPLSLEPPIFLLMRVGLSNENERERETFDDAFVEVATRDREREKEREWERLLEKKRSQKEGDKRGDWID